MKVVARVRAMRSWTVGILLFFVLTGVVFAQGSGRPALLDQEVTNFLDQARSTWSDWNVPYEDGKILHDLVLKGRFRNILEIGTSTGHSTIWLAWAAAKNGGKVITVEIDRGRYEAALANFRKAGVAAYVDARLGDAHELVRTLKGPFDFVFLDADKDWYLRYFLDLEKKIVPGGCFTAHNVLTVWGPVKTFLEEVGRNPRFRTTIERGGGEGISVSCKIPMEDRK
jgi:predicted O-methyltransferase YrrM